MKKKLVKRITIDFWVERPEPEPPPKKTVKRKRTKAEKAVLKRYPK